MKHLQFRTVKLSNKNLSFQVWVRTESEKNQQLIYKPDGQSVLLPPSLPFQHIDDDYIYFQKDNIIVLCFHYERLYQITVCLPVSNDIAQIEDVLNYIYFYARILFIEHMKQTKEIELNTFIESVHAVTSTLDLDNLLSVIINHALRVFPEGDAGFIQLYNHSTDQLVTRASAGFNNKSIRFIKTKIGESITGKVFREGDPKVYHHVADVYTDAHNLSRENFFHLHQAMEKRTIKGVVCVPITVKEERIGVMTIHLYQEGNLISHSTKVLQGFADQAAIAIKNAQLYIEVNKNLEETKKLSNQLEKNNQLLQKRKEIHETLTYLSIQNKGIDPIVSELSQMLGLQVYFLDLIESTFYPRHRQESMPFTMKNILETLYSKKESLQLETERIEESEYYIYPVANRNILLGGLIVCTLTECTIMQQITVEQGRSALALEMVKKQTLTDIYYKKTQERFIDMLESDDLKVKELKGKAFGWEPSSYVLVSIFELTGDHDLLLLETTIHQIIFDLKTKLSRYKCMIFGHLNKITLALSLQDEKEKSDIISIMEEASSKIQQKKPFSLSLGVGRLYKGIQYINNSHDEALKAAHYISLRKKGGISFFEQIGINQLFLDKSYKEMKKFTDEVFEPLTLPNSQTSELKETLFTYIDLNRNAKKSADHLHIHVNTLYQRLKTIEKKLNISLDDPEDILRIQLACHLTKQF